jgi:hypothetical protein
MIGEKVGEVSGKTTGRRVVANDEHGPKLELSIESVGKILGVEMLDYGTYEAIPSVGGTFEGKGLGMAMTKDGDHVTWQANGVGRFTGKGQAVQWRGSIYYRTSSQKLAKLNGACFVYEFDVDESGANHVGRIYEWK